MNRKTLQALRNLDACPVAVAFAAQFPTPQAAWDACEAGDWKEWLLNKLDAWPEGARYEYARASAAAHVKYAHVRADAYAEYASFAVTWAEYTDVRAAAYAEYTCATVAAIRKLVPTVPLLVERVALAAGASAA